MLQWFGASYVAHVLASASATNSVFAIVLGLLGFLYLVSTSLLVCAEINAVRVDRLHPRSLLTPFTDNVELTDADRKMYAGQAEAQQAKGFQRVDVTFNEPHPPPRTTPTAFVPGRARVWPVHIPEAEASLMSVTSRTRSAARWGLKTQRRIALIQALFWPAVVTTGVVSGGLLLAAARRRRAARSGPTQPSGAEAPQTVPLPDSPAATA